MDNNNFKYLHLIVALLIAMGGIIMMITPFEIVQNIGSVLLVSGVYTIIDNFFLKKSLIELVIQKVKLDREIDSCGLVELGSTLTNIDYKELIENSENNIDIIHNYGRTWTTNNFDFVKKNVLEKKCNVRVVLLNPDSLFVPALEKHYNYTTGELKKLILEMTDKWYMLKEELEQKKQECKKKTHSRYKNKKYGNLELYYFNGQPTNSLYRLDDIIIVVNSKTSKQKSIFLPYAIYQNNGSEGMYTEYVKEINTIIEESTKVWG